MCGAALKTRIDQPFLGSTNACNAMIPPAVNSTNPSHLGGLRAFLGDGAVCMKTSRATELASTALVFVILCKARVLVSFNTKLSTSRNCSPRRSKILKSRRLNRRRAGRNGPLCTFSKTGKRLQTKKPSNRWAYRLKQGGAKPSVFP